MSHVESEQNQYSVLSQYKFKRRGVYSDLIVASLQTGSSFATEYLPNIINTFYLSQTGNTENVAGYGLGYMWCNCFGLGVINGLSCGLETLVSQAFGAKQRPLCMKLYYRALFVSLILMIPISLLMGFSEHILFLINGNRQLAEIAGITTTYMIPSILLNGIFVHTKVFLNGQNIYNIQLYTQTATCIASIGLGYIFIIHLDWGVKGCCMVRLILEIMNITIIWSFTNCQRHMLMKFQMKHLHNSFKFFRTAFPIGSVLWLELFCYELYTIQASLLDDDVFTANVILNQTAIFLYQFSYGISIATTTFVGNEMGAKNSKLAYKYAITALLIIAIFLFSTQITIFLLRDVYADFFTSGAPKVVESLVGTMIYMNILSVADGFQGVFSGIVRGIGRETFACLTFITCYMGIGQVTSYLLCFQADWGMKGIWLGMITGATLYDALQLWSMHSKNWETLALKIDQKILAH